MRKADFISPAARLADALTRLEHTWQQTKEHWSDPVSQTVEEDYLIPIHNQVSLMLDAVHKMSEVTGRAERDCSHRRESDTSL
ncbi:MAG: hypothetical protein MK110_14005 [Fuerstiella sp.]|nr:hypothetical protein [Fuerstiella sp.]